MFTKSRFLRTFLLIFVLVSCYSAVSLYPSETYPNEKAESSLKEIPIPVIHVKGSHYEVGRQIGTQLKANLVRRSRR